ncbi:hypothetical protein MTP10_30620 [Nonomuraea sp. 3-1Str]|uniref:hypothetical protein n=1 Tax=Nonomuraea sp. 3-1Str TaxID=2929801 RepID=UPI0028662ED0|nr:hypothetical protein [Nonomuraea sp. 3-1Str]MDR8413074.1 hypothetical protein [Nonomuraea sp. 3-1Str]
MTGEQEPEFLRWIRKVLSQLSWDANRQLEHVRSLKVDVDELALEFDDALHLAQAKVHEGLLSHEALQALLPVDAKLSHMTEHGAELWTKEAVATAAAWEELRAIARQAQLAFGRKHAG